MQIYTHCGTGHVRGKAGGSGVVFVVVVVYLLLGIWLGFVGCFFKKFLPSYSQSKIQTCHEMSLSFGSEF